MPPARRGRPSGSTNSSSSKSRSTAANPQSTLAFGRATSNKITKPSVAPPPSSLKKASKPNERQTKDIAKVIDDETAETTDVKDVKGEEDEDGDELVNEVPALAEGRRMRDDATTMAIREREDVVGGEEEEEEEEEEPVEGGSDAAVEVMVDPAEEKARKVSDAAVKRYWREKEAERKAPRVHQQHLSLHEKILRHFDLSSQYGPCVGIPRVRRWKRAEGLGLKPPIEVLAVLVKDDGGEKGGKGEKGEKGMDRAFMDGLLGGSAVYA